MSHFQGTLGRQIEIVGVGLHTGKLVNVTIKPKQPNYGIRFQRTDLEFAPEISAIPAHIISTTLCTRIGFGDNCVGTIEHLMAAFFGLGVDNALVEVNSPEIPILDGSSAPFVDRILDSGIQRQPVKRKRIDIDFSFSVGDEDQFMRYEPSHSDSLELSCSIDFPRSSAIGTQKFDFIFNQRSFMNISEARTFCHVEDVLRMRENGLALGGSLDNAVVVDHDKVINNDGLRYPDEFVRHKVLDCIGDLALLGGMLSGKITLQKAGHRLHALFTQKVMGILDESFPPVVENASVQSL